MGTDVVVGSALPYGLAVAGGTVGILVASTETALLVAILAFFAGKLLESTYRTVRA